MHRQTVSVSRLALAGWTRTLRLVHDALQSIDDTEVPEIRQTVLSNACEELRIMEYTMSTWNHDIQGTPLA